MALSLLIAALLAAAHSRASPVPSKPYVCHEFTVDLALDNVTTVVPFLPEIESRYQATHYANIFTTRQDPDCNSTPEIEFTSITKSFTIVGEYCTPSKPGNKANTLHLLTHGLGFDRSYWDFYLPSNKFDTQYSYVHAATAAGYSTLSWNRLGIAPSTIANPYTEVQAPVELALLAQLTTLARSAHPSISGLHTAPTTIIHVGHSWGSFLTQALATSAPSLVDAVVLTGWSTSSAYMSNFISSGTLHLATENQPARFPAATYSNGFLTWPDALANQFAFFAYPHFDPAVLEYAEAQAKQPFTLGEFLSQQALPAADADETKQADSTGPTVYIVASGQDMLFCGGNCTGIVGEDVPETKAAFPNAAELKVDVLDGFGHGLNLHYGADRAYEKIMMWVGEKVE